MAGTALKILIKRKYREKLDNEHSDQFLSALDEAGLLHADWSLRGMLRNALEYARRIEGVSGEVKINPVTGLAEGIGGKILLREPGSEQRKLGYLSTDSLLEVADRAFGAAEMRFWVVLDRLDVAFADSPQLEGNALRALFRAYRDMAVLGHVTLTIFLRDDIWTRITAVGFREASHITRSITISWDKPALLHLVVRRALHNAVLREFYKVDPGVVLSNAKQQEILFYRLFPLQIDPGERKSTTLDWMLSRTSDGTGETAPRELIHLLTAARDQQLRTLEMGNPEPPDEALFDRASIKGALPEVSKVRFEQTLCAEHPTLKPMLERLEGEKTQQTPTTLAKIWNVVESTALERAEQLAEVGFFEKRGSKEQPLFWVPFLYRDALNLVQGPAE